MIYQGDSRDILKLLDENSVDAVVCDPPYELSMMLHAWDSTGIAFDPLFWTQVLRVLKPGAHLAFHSAPKYYHRVATAVEQAGFEPREMVSWIFGTGQFLGRSLGEGVGTRLKTGSEPIGIFRKPFDGALIDTFAARRTGGIQIERSRIPYADDADLAETKKKKNPGREDLVTSNTYGADRPQQKVDERGRLPSNLVIDEEVAEELGDRARYFYVVKASRAERDAGLEDFPSIAGGDATKRKEGSAGLSNARAGAGRTGGGKNPHTTVKPLDLMRWLCRLVTPPGGVVLDPFMGSGTTGCAAALEGFNFTGIELSEEYAKIAQARIAHHSKPLQHPQTDADGVYDVVP